MGVSQNVSAMGYSQLKASRPVSAFIHQSSTKKGSVLINPVHKPSHVCVELNTSKKLSAVHLVNRFEKGHLSQIGDIYT